MASTDESKRRSLLVIILALTCLNTAGLITLAWLEFERRNEAKNELALTAVALESANEKALRIRSGHSARVLALALSFLAEENGIGRYPATDEDWLAMLRERHLFDETSFFVPPGTELSKAYHYVPPTQPALAQWKQGGEAPIVIYEDPTLFNDGGNVVRADTTVLWIDNPQFLETVAKLRIP